MPGTLTSEPRSERSDLVRGVIAPDWWPARMVRVIVGSDVDEFLLIPSSRFPVHGLSAAVAL